MSLYCEKVLELVKKTFPFYIIKTEYFVLYNNQRLFFDIYLPELSIAVEVQGEQHDRFVEHFHRDADGFRKSKRRDRIKKEWAQKENIKIVEIRDDNYPITDNDLLNLFLGD